jgi:hypothetical protein
MNRAGTICFTTTWAIRPIRAGMIEHPESVENIPFKGPHDLATVTARPPAGVVPGGAEGVERLWEFFSANISAY